MASPPSISPTSGQSIRPGRNINANVTLQGMGISASVVTEGAQVRLKIETTGSAFTMTETGGGTALTDLGIDNARLLIERDTNTINDLFGGVTLTLFQAEVGTTVKIDVEKDLNSIKTQISDFVTAYNAVKVFIYPVLYRSDHRQGRR
jgi:flagellar capping protein FliD